MTDQLNPNRSLAKIVSAIAATIALIIFITIPAGYFALGYHYEARTLQAEANLGADKVSKIIYAAPDFWHFEEHRLVGVLLQGSLHRDAHRILITSISGQQIAGIPSELDTPVLSRTAELSDGERVVGHLKIEASFRPLLLRTVVATLVGFLLALAIYAALKILPLRALTQVIGRLEESQKLLHEEIQAKGLALLEARNIGVAMRHQALHDSLTNLPNRVLLQDRLQHAVLAAKREKNMFALIMLDLDQFKEINDTLGHQAGDLVLQQIAARLQNALRGSDTVARLGGDEFAILLPAVTGYPAVLIAAQKILGILRLPLTIENRTLHIGASLGIVLFPEHGDDPARLLRCADVAMYSAKRGKTGFAIYDTEQDFQNAKQIALQNDLELAIETNQFVLHYQPKIDLETNYICGVEALVRWEHPKDGLIFPDSFIPIAEHNGLINPLTHLVLEMAIRQAKVWQQKGLILPIAVNISAINLQDQKFTDKVVEVMSNHAASPDLLEMEITESALMVNPLCAIETIKKLRDVGISISIDDFGTGYSSMAYLKKLVVGKIKIDKSFVMEMSKNANDKVLVRAIIDLAHNLGLTVIAEGVETREAMDELKLLHCDTAQGYYISRPVTAEAFSAWVEKSEWKLDKKAT